MGQIPNKTYTAPDGSVYRVEADGSVTKIKGGRVQSNEPPSKYQISPDGKIYKVESDGSVTYLGNAEDYQSSPHPAPTTDIKKSSHKWVWIIIFAVIVALAIGLYVADYSNYYSSTEEYSSNVKPYYENPTQSTEYNEQQNITQPELGNSSNVEPYYENPTQSTEYYEQQSYTQSEAVDSVAYYSGDSVIYF